MISTASRRHTQCIIVEKKIDHVGWMAGHGAALPPRKPKPSQIAAATTAQITFSDQYTRRKTKREEEIRLCWHHHFQNYFHFSSNCSGDTAIIFQLEEREQNLLDLLGHSILLSLLLSFVEPAMKQHTSHEKIDSIGQLYTFFTFHGLPSRKCYFFLYNFRYIYVF